MESANHRPEELARRCAAYSGLVTDVLVDASEGLGLPLDAARSADYLEAIRAAAPELGLVVAGGLHSGNIAELLSPLLPEWSAVSIDAEGRCAMRTTGCTSQQRWRIWCGDRDAGIGNLAVAGGINECAFRE